MGDLYIHHHLGLGDMIHCNGIIRALLEQRAPNDRVFVFSKNCHKAATDWMYRDEPGIHVIGIDERGDEVAQVNSMVSNMKNIDFLRIGHEFYEPTAKLNMDTTDHWTCDIIFYKQLGMPYEWRYTKCYWERDLDEEDRVYRKLAPKNSDYVFVHDDPSRGFVITEEQVGTNLPIVRNDISENIFLFGKLLENAKEVHLMESSIRCMIESLDTGGVNLVFYSFRGGPFYNEEKKKWSGTSKNWEKR